MVLAKVLGVQAAVGAIQVKGHDVVAVECLCFVAVGFGANLGLAA